jgi:hypothetical protein
MSEDTIAPPPAPEDAAPPLATEDAAPPPAPEEPTMEIHKPKPVHSWREFVTELAVVVLGVFIALSAEQAMETVHANQRASRARTSIRAEIAYNLGQMEVRAVTERCVTSRLAEVDGLIAAAAAGKLPPGEVWIGRPIITFGRDSQYKAASEAGNISLMAEPEQAAYAAIYRLFATDVQSQEGEQKAWADIRILEKHPLPSPAMDALLHSAVQQARISRWLIEAAHTRALNASAEIGITPGEREFYNPVSICLPLNTPRAEAVKLVIQGRPGHYVYDEP